MSDSNSADTPSTADNRGATRSAFALSPERRSKSIPTLIAGDERHFAAIEASLEDSVADLTARLDETRKSVGRAGREAMERDFEVHRLTGRLRTLRRYGLDLCLGHMVDAESGNTVYIGRVALLDASGEQLLVDWRSPAAEPFFGATHANPMGLARRRRYRWFGGRIEDYWDEVFAVDGRGDADDGIRRVALDDQSAFIAGLGESRSPRMRDVLGTIQADQDAVIRAEARGALVVDGGPGTGKTVVALHRTAYLLYADAHVGRNRGGVLFVGPHEPYLRYVSDVLPSLGEDGVRTCTLRTLVAEGADAEQETNPDVARLKSSAALVGAIEAAVRFYEQPPTIGMTVETEWGDLCVEVDDWAEAFDAPAPGIPHNEAREAVRGLLVEILLDKYDGVASRSLVRDALLRNDELRRALDSAWTLIEAADLVADLWSVPAYLRKCAPWLSNDDVRALQRADPNRWTLPDLPLLDAARHRLGDPTFSTRQHRRDAVAAAERRRMDRVIDEMLQGPDDDGLLAQLRQDGIRNALDDESVLPSASEDDLAGPFGHIVVDEAQELTDAEWQMLLRRCPSHSFTIVGDRAQARHGFAESWSERLQRAGFERIGSTSLSINYRTPEEVMREAEPVIRAVLPDANVPFSIRSSGIPVIYEAAHRVDAIVREWSDDNVEGIGCVLGSSNFEPTSRVRALTPELTKGLEFDLVILVNPEAFGSGIEGAVDRYVAMTRATRQLVILTG
ncbi:MAG: RNA polymerase recycling motor ATPase HelR [Rhodococcus sp. (in: high G+C Gram-positive bacteria)]